MKILLVQLPVPNSRHSNLPLALGYLKASAEAARLPGLEVRLLEAELQNRGGDAMLVEAILAQDPDVVGFSLYTWNSSRSLALAAALKQAAPGLLVLGGGPEVNHDGDFVLASPDFDFLVVGQGERTFVELLRALISRSSNLSAVRGLVYRPDRYPQTADTAQNLKTLNLKLALPGGSSTKIQNWIFNPPQPALADVNLLPSVYLSGALEGQLAKTMSIELSRWCPSKCTFCYYGRQDLPSGGKRYFEIERIRQELLFGLAQGVEQVHFVEANFNSLPHLDRLYQTIRETGANRRMSFYAELRGEAIDQAEAERLAECNFSIVEVGLQSAVPEVLAQVRRKNHLPRLVQGVHNLRAKGIEVFLDVILGLPGETPLTYRRTLDFVEQNGLAPYDLFHLQILSGTQLKAEAITGQHGLNWQAAPPYFVLETAGLSFADLCRLRQETYQRKGEDPAFIAGLTPPGPFALAELPAHAIQPVISPGVPIERVMLDLRPGSATFTIDKSVFSELARQLSSQVTLWLRLSQSEEIALARAVEVLQTLSRPNPSGVWQIFVEANRPLSGAEQTRLRAAIEHQTGYLDRLAVFGLGQPDPTQFEQSPSVSFYPVLPFSPGPPADARPETVWKVCLEAAASLQEWQSSLLAVAQTAGAGLYLITPPDTNPAKLKAALQVLGAAQPQLWLSDWRLASGLAYSQAEGKVGAELSLDYPPTFQGRAGQVGYCQPAHADLEQAALRWYTAR